MLIQLPDAVALKYQTAAARARVPLDKFLARQLTRFADTPVDERTLVLRGEDLARLDQILGIGSSQSPPALTTAIEARASVTIGGIRVEFSTAQLEEIAHRAEKQGKPPSEIVRDIVDQMAWRFFEDAIVAR